MADNERIADNHVDDHVDDKIAAYLSASPPRSFFTFAGAGSGKTRSLTKALEYIEENLGEVLALRGQKVAVITYTNVACDEIQQRLKNTSMFLISTIHSFLWELIKNYQQDIREWLADNLKAEIDELESKQQSVKKPNKTSIERGEKITRKQARLAKLTQIQRFTYNPNGDNLSSDSLNHEEVIKMGSYFISEKSMMQKILISKFPILLIDESQDTKKALIDALLKVYESHKDHFLIGMFGDTMQRIFMDGKDNLAVCIPADWEKPTKAMNHRSARRIVELANAMRSSIDDQKQQARSDAEEGVVRLFIVGSSPDKPATEWTIMNRMAEITKDSNWQASNKLKVFALEHHMAASRLGFSELYDPLRKVSSFGTALLDGTLPELSLLSNRVLPLIKAYENNLEFEVSKIMRQHSPLISNKRFVGCSENQMKLIQDARSSVEMLCSLWDNGRQPTCIEVLQKVKETNIFDISECMEEVLFSPEEESEDEKVSALHQALKAPFSQLEQYAAYVANETPFATHQGVKGLEFPRVMVILDDEEAKGFLFSYDKLFGAKAESDRDIQNKREGKDTSIARTTRLFYVACTRAEKSLAVVAYTADPGAVKTTAISNGWFRDEEIILFS